MYVVMAGTSIGWLGAMLAAKSPIDTSYLVPLIGVVGGISHFQFLLSFFFFFGYLFYFSN